MSGESSEELKNEISQAEIQERLVRIKSRSLLDNIALINTVTIGIFVAAAAYELLHTDIEAAEALFKYNDVMEASAWRTSVQLFLRLPADSIHAYEALVPTNPVFYKACTSGVAYTIGDFVSQVYQGRTLDTIDLKRSARSGAAGFIGHGPLCHYWMLFMENNLDFGGAWWGTGVKVLADQTVWSIYLNAMYSFLIGSLALRSPKDVWQDVKATSWPALRTSWRFWPFVHCISFSHAVPLDLKLLWVDVMEIVWVTLLSKVANDDKDANVAPNKESCVVDGGIADPVAEVAMTMMQERTESDGTESGSGSMSSKLIGMSQKGFNAAWPLAAMWPVLFLFDKAETALGIVG